MCLYSLCLVLVISSIFTNIWFYCLFYGHSFSMARSSIQSNSWVSIIVPQSTQYLKILTQRLVLVLTLMGPDFFKALCFSLAFCSKVHFCLLQMLCNIYATFLPKSSWKSNEAVPTLHLCGSFAHSLAHDCTSPRMRNTGLLDNVPKASACIKYNVWRYN